MSSTRMNRAKRNGAVIIILAVAVCSSSRLEAQNTVIAGVVKNASGSSIAGALVKVSSEGLGVGFMVVSQGQGRYVTPNLPPGKYTIDGFGGTYESEPSPLVEVGSGQQTKVDVVLTVPLQIPPRTKRMTDADYAKLMPDELDKHTIENICAECHSLGWVVSARKTPEKWRETLDRMQDKLISDRRSLSELLVPHNQVKDDPLTMAYVSKNYAPNVPVDLRVQEEWLPYKGGPSHPNRNLPPSVLEGKASKYVAMEFSLPTGSAPQDIAVDSRGLAWVSERDGGMLGRFDVNSMTYTRVLPPDGKNSKRQLHAVAVDPQDHVWFVDDGPNALIYQYDSSKHEFSSYPIPEYGWPVPDIGWARIQTISFLNGDVWAAGTTTDRLLRLNPATRKMLHVSLPKGSVPFGMAISADKKVWYAGEVSDTVVSVDPSNGRLTHNNLPTFRSDLRGLAADAAGGVWVAGMESNKLVNVDRSGKVSEYSLPTPESGPFAVAVDKKQNLVWLSEILTDRIARFDPNTNSFVEFPHPSSDSDVRRIEVDPTNPNRIWWVSAREDKVGYIEVLEKE